MSPPRGRSAALLPLLLLVLLPLCCHLGSGFFLDDYFHLTRASRPFGADALRFAIRTDDYGMVLWPQAAPLRLEFLRPATMLSFWLEYRAWGLRAWGYHLDNLLLQLLNIGLLLSIARRQGLSAATAALVAAAWGLSFQAVPASGWVSGRTELLCGTFTLGAVLALDQWVWRGQARWFAAAVGLAGLAPLAKETGVIAPLLLLVAWRMRTLRSQGRPARTPGIAHVAALFLPALAYTWVRFAALRIGAPHVPYLEPVAAPLDFLWLCLKPLLYLFVALFSLPLSHLSPLVRLHDQPALFLLVAAAVAPVLAWLWRSAGGATTALLLAWFLAALLPCLPILPTSLYLYLPLAGLALLLGHAADGAGRSRAARAWLAAWGVAGIVANVAIASFTASAARALSVAARELEGDVERQHASRVLLADVPVWAYGLPAAVHLANPSLEFETWVLNFSPAIRPGAASALRWTDRLTLEARAPGGRYFDSPVERFLLFGADPADTLASRRGGAIRVLPQPVSATPAALRARFRDPATLARCAVLQFRGWQLVPVPAPAFADSARLIAPPPPAE